MSGLDDHGQPKNKSFNAVRINDRKIDELIGICKGISVDKELSDNEIQFLTQWLDRNRDICWMFPANQIYSRLHAFLSDGVIDDDERAELLQIITDTSGGEHAHDNYSDLSTKLGLTKEVPEIDFDGTLFCFTGKFAVGIRKKCIEMVESVGGLAKNTITKDLDYLVIGSVGSADWIHSTHGRKIEKAMEYDLCIVSEKQWYEQLNSAPTIEEQNQPFTDGEKNVLNRLSESIRPENYEHPFDEASIECVSQYQSYPEPSIAFEKMKFSFTGDFDIETRTLTKQVIEALGGEIIYKNLDTLDYLIVGIYGEEGFDYETGCGGKWGQVVELVKSGEPIEIISELHFWREVFRTGNLINGSN